MVEKTHFEELLLNKLDTISKLLSLIILKDEQTVEGKVNLLHTSGFKRKEISEILDKKLNNIDQVLHNIKVKQEKKEKEAIKQ